MWGATLSLIFIIEMQIASSFGKLTKTESYVYTIVPTLIGTYVPRDKVRMKKVWKLPLTRVEYQFLEHKKLFFLGFLVQNIT